MFKIKFIPKKGYAEEGQDNPIRWLLVSKQGDTLIQESDWIKCKDFFNDYAYTIQTGKDFSIYSFNAGTMNPPKKGEPVYMVVKNLTPEFFSNFEVMNNWLTKDQSIPAVGIEQIDKTSAVLTFDPFYFLNTYNISLISLLIRIINCNTILPTFDAIAKYKPEGYGDQQKWGAVVKKNVFFAIPDKLKDFVWYCDAKYNSKSEVPQYQLASLVHNNGVLSWGANF